MILKNTRILVTGGAGFIGSHICEELLKQGVFVTSLDIKKSQQKLINKTYYQEIIEDICQTNVINKILKKGFDYIIHQAALASVPDSIKNPITYIETNLKGTGNIFEAAKENKIKRIVYATSCAVESLNSPYALTKYWNENLALWYQKTWNIDYVGLRYYNVYGEYQTILNEGAIIPTIINKLLKKEPLYINGNGLQTRDFIYAKDIAKANILALTCKNPNLIYSLGTGKETSILKLTDIISTILKVKPNIIFTPERLGDIQKSRISGINLYKTKKDLIWKVETSLIEGLKLTCKYYASLIG